MLPTHVTGQKLRIEELMRSVENLKGQAATFAQTCVLRDGQERVSRFIEKETRGTLLEGTSLDQDGTLSFLKAEKRYLALPPAWLKLIVKLLRDLIAKLETLEKDVISPQRGMLPLSPGGAKVIKDVGLEILLTQGTVTGFETEIVIRGAHAVRPISISASALKNRAGKIYGGVIVAQDLSEIRRLQQEHITAMEAEKRKLEVVNKELEAFSYSVSHDLRAPLRAIDGFAKVLDEEYAGKLDNEGRRLLSIIQKNSGQMAKLIDDLLAFSRMGRHEIKKEYIAMGALANDVFQELSQAEPERKIECNIQELSDSRADSNMLRLVWTNLFSNAIKFTKPREKAVIEVGSKIEGERIIYYVKDNGVGFDMKYIDKLFGVFQRLHDVAEFEGTGVGLANVKLIVERHGGTVWAEGKVDEGATFYFALPGV
ncbi:MAG: hypothetical protein HY006_01860 [Candidatus Sungbacteria bacterium]|nr:hypothetical protein [Candidatus Sungbacteria bacterium]